MMYMPKRDPWHLMLHEFKLGHNVSETFNNINRAQEEVSTCNQTVQK